MKVYKYISVASTPLQSTIKRVLDDVGITERNAGLTIIDGSYFGIRLRQDDPRIAELTAALDKLPLDPPWDYRVEVEYERSDLEPCEFVSLHVKRAPKGHTGPMYDTEYDLATACPECGTGARQVSPLRISASAFPKKGRALPTYSHEILIDNDLATDLMIVIGSERGLRQAVERRIRTMLPWWQILPDTYMPPADPATGYRLDEDMPQCPVCKRDGFVGPGHMRPMEFTYRMSEDEIRALPDFVYTWEHFGISRIKWKPGCRIGFASADILVSNRVMRAFWAAKVREAEFTPVRFIR